MKMRKMLKLVATLAFLAGVSSEVQALDLSPWERVLKKYVSLKGVNYRNLKEDTTTRADLNRFVASLAKMPDKAPLADWLNAYNALVLHSVVEAYPLRKVTDKPNFFKASVHTVAGKKYSLDAIENKVIRKRFPDSRIHAALNCGAVSCPPLHVRPFRQASLDKTLEGLARRFARSRRYVKKSKGKVKVSEIYKWYKSDFKRDAGSVVGWIRKHGNDQIDASTKDADLDYMYYNWKLNESQNP